MDIFTSIPRSILSIISDIAERGELHRTYRIVEYPSKRFFYEVIPTKTTIKVNFRKYDEKNFRP